MRLFDENRHFEIICRRFAFSEGTESPAKRKCLSCRTRSLRLLLVREDTAKSGIFCKQIVGIAPHPFLSGLRGNDHGMAGAVEVLCHVFVTGLVTAQGGATGLAGAEMHPGAADHYSSVTDMLFFLFEFLYLPHVGANLICHVDIFKAGPWVRTGYTSAKYL
jgi:hypothetical protein